MLNALAHWSLVGAGSEWNSTEIVSANWLVDSQISCEFLL